MKKDEVMKCPPDIAEVLAELLYRGLLRVRAFAKPGYERRCFIEADHLHNLPHILTDYKVERLQYYWDMERRSFLKQVQENETRDLAPLWDRLEVLMNSHGIPHRETPVLSETRHSDCEDEDGTLKAMN